MVRVPPRIGYGEGGGKLPMLAGILTDLISGGHARLLTLSGTQAAAASTTGVHAAIPDIEEEQVITTGITNPAWPRNITATSGGTAADIKAVQVIIEGTDIEGNVITETLPAFTADTATTVVGNKAFATVTSITVPAHDGDGATTAIGWGSKLGLPVKLPTNTVLFANLNHVREGTAPSVSVNASDVSLNTVALNTSLNGSPVAIAYIAVGS